MTTLRRRKPQVKPPVKLSKIRELRLKEGIAPPEEVWRDPSQRLRSTPLEDPAVEEEIQPNSFELIQGSSIACPTHSSILWERERILITLPHQQIFDLVRDGKIKQKIERILPQLIQLPGEQKKEILYETRMRVIREDYKEHGEYREKQKNIYGDALWIKDPYLPRPFMDTNYEGHKTNKDREIAEQLTERLKQKTRFIDVFNYLDSKVIQDPKDLIDEKYAKKDLIGGREIQIGGQWNYALIRINEAFYDRMSNMLSVGNKTITYPTLKKYLSAFCDLGILKLL